MKVLIVFYSRQGVTRRLAHRLAEAFDGHDCCIEQIIDLKDRSGPIGLLRSGADAIFGKLTRIEAPKEYPSDYDLVLVGTPTWTGNISPAIRTYLMQFGGSSEKVAYFCTFRVAGYGLAFRRLRKFFQYDPVAALAVKNSHIRADKFADQVGQYISEITSAMSAPGD